MTIWYTRDPDAVTHWTTHDPLTLPGARLYYVIYSSALGAPTAQQIIEGKDTTGALAVASGSEPSPSVTTVYDFAAATLPTGTYKVAFVWWDQTPGSYVPPNVSNVDVSGSFTITAATNLKHWAGAAWVPKPLKYWDGSAWVVKPLKWYTGSAWA